MRFAPDVEHAAEALAHADRPRERHGGHSEDLLDLVDQLERLAHFAVHLVDEGDDRRVARAAHFEQAQRLRFHAVGRVDHHERRVDGGQHAVGVFREILVAGRIEQVDDAAAILHLHDRARDRDAALLLDFHPVGGRVARRLARLDAAGDVDRAREEQQLLGERGLARVRVRDDGKSARPSGFFFNLLVGWAKNEKKRPACSAGLHRAGLHPAPSYHYEACTGKKFAPSVRWRMFFAGPVKRGRAWIGAGTRFGTGSIRRSSALDRPTSRWRGSSGSCSS